MDSTTRLGPTITGFTARAVGCHSFSVPGLVTLPEDDDFVLRFSSYNRLRRVTAYILHFKDSLQIKPRPHFPPYLTVAELERAQTLLDKRAQGMFYRTEIQSLTSKLDIKAKSTLTSLRPFIDDQGILRVGGRVVNSTLPLHEKHPIILPKDAHLTKLLVNHAHLQTLHGGQQLTLSYILRTYWIVHGRSLVFSIIKKCVRCARFTVKPQHQLMGALPPSRVQLCRPFFKASVDYAGPFNIRVSKGRGQRSHKGYLCIFVCMSTRAIHIEVVSDYSAVAFIAAFKRMISRRGRCTELYSDNGTTFHGADNEMKKLLRDAARNQSLAMQLENDGTQWKFIPPGAPHFGGLWESAVKSTKYHLRRISGDSTLTYEDLSTLVAEIEACLNSRPISALSNDPQDLSAPTSGHLLIGSAITCLPEPGDESMTQLSKISRWFVLSKMKQDFWRRWHAEYLRALQQRHKWKNISENLQPGDLVLLCNENQPPSKWVLARITRTYPGNDGLVRVVDLQSSTTTLTRPIENVCKLPFYDTHSVDKEFQHGGRK